MFKLHPSRSHEANCWLAFLHRMGWARVTVIHSQDTAGYQFLNHLRHIAVESNLKASGDRELVSLSLLLINYAVFSVRVQYK